MAAMVKATVDTFGRLDMAFNNAGIQVPPSDAADELAEDLRPVNAINLRGVGSMKHELGQCAPRAAAPSSTALPRRSRRTPGPGCLPRLQARRDRG